MRDVQYLGDGCLIAGDSGNDMEALFAEDYPFMNNIVRLLVENTTGDVRVVLERLLEQCESRGNYTVIKAAWIRVLERLRNNSIDSEAEEVRKRDERDYLEKLRFRFRDETTRPTSFTRLGPYSVVHAMEVLERAWKIWGKAK